MVATLTGPGMLATSPNATVINFTAPADTVLAAGTTYYVHVTNGAGTGGFGTVERTLTGRADAGTADGWELGARYWRNNSTAGWSKSGNRALIAVYGTAVAAAPPTIASFEFTSDPNEDGRDGDDASYAIGDAVEATVTFSEAVTVDTTGGTPQLALEIGDQTRQASYASGSGSTKLVFGYTVVVGDPDGLGIGFAANALGLNGATIKGGSGEDAALVNAVVAADTDHKMDGVRPTVKSVETSVDGSKLLVTFSETLSSISDGNFSAGGLAPIDAGTGTFVDDVVTFKIATFACVR